MYTNITYIGLFGSLGKMMSLSFGFGYRRFLWGLEGWWAMIFKGTLLGTPNREPQEYSRYIMEYKDPGRYIPIICLLYSWGFRFGVPSRVPLILGSVHGTW